MCTFRPALRAGLRDLFRDAEEYVRTVRELWRTFPGESLSSGNSFLHRDMVAPLQLTGRERYPAAGPLTVPVLRTPKVAVLAHHALEPYQLAAAVADRVFVTPSRAHPIPVLLEAFQEIEKLTPDATETEVYADVAVVLGDTDEHAETRLAQLNEAATSSGHRIRTYSSEPPIDSPENSSAGVSSSA